MIEIWVDQEDGKERTAEMLLSHWGEFMENRICYLNDLDQEHRRNVLEKHLAHFIGQKENANVSPSRKQGHIRITRELIITGTSNPTLEIAQPNRMECIATLTL